MGNSKKKQEGKNSEVKQKRRKQGKENAELLKGVQIANKAVQKENKKREKDKTKQRKEKQKEDRTKQPFVGYILLFTVTILIVIFFKYRHVIGITFSREISEKDAIVVETITSDNKIYAYQNQILAYSKGKLVTYSKYGKNTWEYSFDETFIPSISTKGKYIQVVNKENGYIYVFDNKYETCRKKINGIIKQASINSKGQSAIHYSKEGAKSNIGIYDKKGNEEYTITLPTDNVAKVDLSDNGKYLMFYEVDTEGISVNSVLKVVDLKSGDKADTVLELKNDVIYDVILKNTKIYVLTADKIYISDIVSKSKKEYDLGDKNISNISIDGSGFAYVDKQLAQDKSTLKILNNMYNKVGEYKIEYNVKNLQYSNLLAYVIGSKEINIYNRWGMHIKRYTSDSPITSPVIFNSGKNIAINYSNRIVIIGI